MSGCSKPLLRHGYCNAHALKWRRFGDPLHGTSRPADPVERFRSRCKELPSGCIIWTGTITKAGYGVIRVDKVSWLAHRFALHLAGIELDPDLVVDHLCRVRACVNVNHLEQVTNIENVLRGEGSPAANARKTHCKRGHEFTPENTFRRPCDGGRQCMTCTREWIDANRALVNERRRLRRAATT